MIEIKLSKISSLLLKSNNFIITTHVNPDGDAIGSEIAMYDALIQNGKRAQIINCSPTPYFAQFLDYESIIEVYNKEKHFETILNAQAIICLDFNSISRINDIAEPYKLCKGIKICIDHHLNPSDQFDYIHTDTFACATGEILFDLFRLTKFLPLFTYEISQALFCAIMTDTGSFRYDRTSAKVFKDCSRLVAIGAEPDKIYNQYFDSNPVSKLRLSGKALSSLRLVDEKGELVVILITQEDLIETGANEAETDSFTTMMMSIKGVKVGLFFLELSDGFKVSLRSKGNIDVQNIANKFGGGGHRNASGLRMVNADYKELMPIIISDSLAQLKAQQ